MPRPGTGSGNIGQAGSRPSFGDHSSGIASRPSTGAGRPGGINGPGSGSTFDNVLNNGGRPSTRPGGATTLPGNTRPGSGAGGIQRPGGEGGFRPGEGTRPGADGGGIQRPGGDGNLRPGDGSNRPGPGGDNQPGNGNRPGAGGDHRPGNGNHFRPGGTHNNNQNWANNIHNDWHNHWNNNNWHNNFTNINGNIYRPGWRGHYPHYANGYWRNHGHYPYGWWTLATATAVGSWMGGWFGGGFSEPVYYDYGSSGNVYYEGDTVYVDGQAAASAEEYAAQAQQLAATGAEQLTQPRAEENQMEWMPLGVFALSTSEDEKSPTRMLQMAVSKDGVINGTMFDTETKKSQPIVGAVDKATQRACWYVGDNKDVVAETGLYNLTQDQTTVLVHYGADRTEEYLLVRLDPPADAKESNVNQSVPAAPSGTNQ